MTPLDRAIHLPTGRACRVAAVWKTNGFVKTKLALVMFEDKTRRTVAQSTLQPIVVESNQRLLRRLAKGLGLTVKQVMEARA